MKTTPLLHSRSLALAALVATLLALAPGRAAADPAAIFVSTGNYDAGYVPAYDSTGAGATGYTAPSGLTLPEGLAWNPANGMLYVADAQTSQIRTFNAANGAETSIGFANATGLVGPEGLALNAGVLYAANFGGTAVTAYNAANGARVTSGFKSPTVPKGSTGLAVNATTLFVANENNNTLGAFNLATGTAAAGFTPITTGLNRPLGVALFGNDLFVANLSSQTVGEYDATTGAVINASFVTGVANPYGLAILGNRLLVADNLNNTVGAYGIPAVALLNNVPTSSNASFLTVPDGPTYVAIANVPEPSTWALLTLGTAALGLALRRRAAARA